MTKRKNKTYTTEFKQEAMNLFTSLLFEINKEINVTIFKVTPDIVPSGLLKTQTSVIE